MVCVCVPAISITQKQIKQKHQIWYFTFVSNTNATWNFLKRSDKNSVYISISMFRIAEKMKITQRKVWAVEGITQNFPGKRFMTNFELFV